MEISLCKLVFYLTSVEDTAIGQAWSRTKLIGCSEGIRSHRYALATLVRPGEIVVGMRRQLSLLRKPYAGCEIPEDVLTRWDHIHNRLKIIKAKTGMSVGWLCIDPNTVRLIEAVVIRASDDEITLLGTDLGSMQFGTPVYFRTRGSLRLIGFGIGKRKVLPANLIL